jgi:hypothetical protein
MTRILVTRYYITDKTKERQQSSAHSAQHAMPPALMQPAIPQHSCCRQREIRTLPALRRCKELRHDPAHRQLLAIW